MLKFLNLSLNLLLGYRKKYGFVPTYQHCGVASHIRPNCSLLSQEPKLVTRDPSRNTDVPKFVHVYHFCGVTNHISSNCHKLIFKHSIIQSRTGDDVLPMTSLENFFCLLLKNLNMLTCDWKF